MDDESKRELILLPPGGGRKYPMGRIWSIFKADGAETARGEHDRPRRALGQVEGSETPFP